MTEDQSIYRVVAADDHGVFLDGLALLFQRIQTFDLIAAAKNGDDAITAVLKHSPDLLLMDLSMPGQTSKKILDTLSQQSPNTRVIALTMHCDATRAQLLLSHGLDGYLLKDQSFDQIERAMSMVVGGEQYLCPAIREELAALESQERPTERELEVLALLAEGLPNKSIARSLDISERTVRFHVSNCCIKLNAVGRTQAVTEAIRRELVS